MQRRKIEYWKILMCFLMIACQDKKQENPNLQLNGITHQFIHHLNFHQTDSLMFVISEGIRFQDAQNRVLQGRQKVAQGWRKYWELFPDYQIDLEDIYIKENKVAIFGTAKATYMNKQSENNENQWEIPIAWQINIQNNKITDWKMYGDTKIIYEIIQQNAVDRD